MFLIIMLDVKKKRYGFRKDMEGEECPMQMIIEPKRFLHKTSSHLYVQPHPFLKKAVAHYTILQESAYTGQETLLLVPDISGCIVFKVKKNTIDAQYWGPTTKLVEVQAEPDDAYFSFFIEFHQGGAYQLFQRGLQELLDEKIQLSKILPELQEQMIEAYMQSTTLEMFLAKIDSILLSGERKDSHIVTMLRKQMHPQVSLKEVGNAIGYSERHVQRIFLEQIGCSMKHYQRVQRMNLAIHLLQNAHSLIQVAQLCGYYDQSHFIHDFIRVCGCTPKAYVEKMTSYYQEPYKF